MLKHFSLANEDFDYKLLYARKALEFNSEIKFFSAAWTAPLWMKSNDNGLSTYDRGVLKQIRKSKKTVINLIIVD